MAAQLIRISAETEVPLLCYREQPVLTFSQIDTLHGRPEGTARTAFHRNRKRFIEGEDFYVLESESLYVWRTEFPDMVGANAPSLTLLTESGYLMLTKPFGDDLSWQIQRQLVKLYFRVKEVVNQPTPTAAATPPVLPPAAPELVSAGDMQNLTRLVWLTTHWFRQQGSFVRAVWKALRAATGVPSPQRFQVQHIPLLAAEIRRIHLITRALADLIAEAERTAICRILNRGERTEKVLLDIKNALAQANAADLQGINQQLGKWDEQELDAFIKRMPAKTCAYPEFEEMGWEG